MSLSLQQLSLPDGPLFVSRKPVMGQGKIQPMPQPLPEQLALIEKVGVGGQVFVARQVKGDNFGIGIFETPQEALKVAYQWISTWGGDEAIQSGEFETFAQAHFAEPHLATTINSARHTTLAPGFFPMNSEFVTVMRATIR